MSYKGYIEYLCSNGHRRVFDCYNEPLPDKRCNCGAKYVWLNIVDETNNEGTPYPLEIDIPEQGEKCNMGHFHVTREITYKIPVKE